MSHPGEISRRSSLAIARAAIAAIEADPRPLVELSPGAGGPPAAVSAQHNVAPRHMAPHVQRQIRRTNPPPTTADALQDRSRSLEARQLTAARLLLAGKRAGEVASALGVHRYTITRWKRDPLFQAELRRQLTLAGSSAAPSRAAPHGATNCRAVQNEPTAGQARRGQAPV